MEIFLRYVVVFVILPLLLGISIYFSVRLRWPQLQHLRKGLRRVIASKATKGKMGNFAAVATIVGGNLGAGTIAGSALAIAMGGAGAIFWMVAVALLGSVIKLACATLGVFYQEKCHEHSVGGAMFYIRKGLNAPFWSVFYCVCLVGASFTVGNLVQVHAFMSPFAQSRLCVQIFGILLLMIPVVLVLFGGLKRFAAFMSCTVPIIGAIYILACIVGIFLLRHNVAAVGREIFRGAFSLNAAGGGSTGFLFGQALQAGISRGLFATDIGLGLAAIAHGNVERGRLSLAEHAKDQGIIALLAPILVAILCAMTGILVLCAAPNFKGNASQICIDTFSIAFRTPHAGYFIPFIIYCFAMTTILAWAWFAEHAFTSDRWHTIYRLLFIAIMPIGAVLHGSLPWTLADICIDGLLLTNLIAIFCLRGCVIGIHNDGSLPRR
jgi:AGCS family alanine or glycine:cation symporter